MDVYSKKPLEALGWGDGCFDQPRTRHSNRGELAQDSLVRIVWFVLLSPTQNPNGIPSFRITDQRNENLKSRFVFSCRGSDGEQLLTGCETSEKR
jgi:hypothetical protein